MFKKFNEINEFRITEKSVYLLIHEKGPISKSSIVKELGGSLTNINRFIAELEKEELIIGTKGSGRKAGEFSINSDAVYSMGAYLNADVIGMGLCDIGGKVIDSVEGFFSEYSTPENALSFFESAYKKLSNNIDSAKIIGTGIGIVGPLDNEYKTILMPEQLPGWHNVPIVKMLEVQLGSPVILDYFAETALAGELLFKKHDLNKDLGLLWIDKGIGSSLYNRGKSSLHHRDQSALLAHQVIDFKGIPCVCGRRGCLHTIGNIPSLARNLSPFIIEDKIINQKNEEKFKMNPWNFSSELETVFRAIDSDENSQQIDFVLNEMKEAYKAALGNFIYLLRPEELIFCGRMSVRFKEMFESIISDMNKLSGYYPEIELTSSWINLDSKKMIQGGAALVFNKHMKFTV